MRARSSHPPIPPVCCLLFLSRRHAFYPASKRAQIRRLRLSLNPFRTQACEPLDKTTRVQHAPSCMQSSITFSSIFLYQSLSPDFVAALHRRTWTKCIIHSSLQRTILALGAGGCKQPHLSNPLRIYFLFSVRTRTLPAGLSLPASASYKSACQTPGTMREHTTVAGSWHRGAGRPRTHAGQRAAQDRRHGVRASLELVPAIT